MTIKTFRFRTFALGLNLAIGLIPAIWSANLHALDNLSGAQIIDFESKPVLTLESVTPKVMLTMSRDHQYFFKAYNDYTDLDGDGDIDTTYKHSFEYYGYFDPDKCYTYESITLGSTGAHEVFVPKDWAVGRYCDTVSGDWSGNFLNWASMSRIDIVRKILYGGQRYLDLAAFTILQRANLPSDAHSFAKYYNGTDIAKLTPFTVPTDTIASGGNGNGVDDVNEGLTICNTTKPANASNSHKTTEPPLIRVAQGNFALWGAEEVFQCHWEAGVSANPPPNTAERGGNNSNDGNGNIPAASGLEAFNHSPNYNLDGLHAGTFGPDFNARVYVCVAGLIAGANDNENCRAYENGTGVVRMKPAGLLQEYGEEGSIEFGLMTGSFEKNISGGVLRKNPGPLSDEIDFNNGSFLGATNNAPRVGIIRTLDRLRVFGYRYGGGTSARRYFDTGSDDNCRFQQATIVEGDCNSWGNPISEIYAETLRYFAGLSPTTAYGATDDNFIEGLDEAAWVDPLNTNNFCAGLSTVVFNASLSSYDEGSAASFITGAPSPVALTNAVGAAEGFDGNEYFVGRTGPKTVPVNATNDEFCSPKAVNGLGNVSGLCPEGPTVDGTFHIAGMANYAHLNDIRPGTLEDDQLVTTYAVQLATNVPRIEIPVDADRTVTLLPAYRLTKNDGGGSLVDFKVVKKHGPTTPGKFTGKFMVLWEDSEQGGDFDKDMWGVIEYELDTSTPTPSVLVTTDAVTERTSNAQLFGFVISGTTQDGFHAYSGIESAKFEDPDPTIPDCNEPFPAPATGSNANTACDVGDSPRSHRFTVSTTPGAGLLPDPLLLAAKYGAFDDENGNGIPDLESEFDRRDLNGNVTPGGDAADTPDTYFFVTNPAALESSLRAVFNQIIERVASGTAAAVVAATREGTGAVIQALYDPIKSDTFGNEVKWIGTLHSFFVDPAGFLREDGDGDAILDDYNTDKRFEIFYDEANKRARLRRFTSSSATEFIQSGFTESELTELEPLWNARQELSKMTDSDVLNQRTYSDKAEDGRYIFTWLDTNYDNKVALDRSEEKPFVPSTFTSSTFGWLDVWDGVTTPPNETEAQKLVNYIRGVDQPGYRPRKVDYENNGTVETLRLGDIVNSTPIVETSPRGGYNIRSGDLSYTAFAERYQERRNMVYVGANDGMIHAFNGGFFDARDNKFVKQLNGETDHALGTEIWAYIPKNLLGHLQWLTDNDYPHVFYNDLPPFTFDAKIFTDTSRFPAADYPNGWGTVLVVGMRLGGGHDSNGITLDTAADGIGASDADADTTDDVLTKSAYVVLDITNPEQPPRVLAELSPPGQNFTTGAPAFTVVGERQPTATVNPPNKWFLLFGSGPNNLTDVDSNLTGRLFAYDLAELVAGNTAIVETGPFADDGTPNDGIGFANTGEAARFIGDIEFTDQDLDMKAEAIYFGSVGGESGVGGSFYKLKVGEDPDPANWGNEFKLIDSNQPFATKPTVSIDEDFNTWITATTGRVYSADDKSSTAQQTMYGFIDADTGVTLSHGSFIDTTNAVTSTNGDIDSNGDTDGDSNADTTFDALTADVEAAGGWFFNYELNGTDPAERSSTNPTLFRGIILSSAFTPSNELCGAEGSSRTIGRAFNSGLVPPAGVFGVGSVCTGGCGEGEVPVTEAIGETARVIGAQSSTVVHVGYSGGDSVNSDSTNTAMSTASTAASGASQVTALNNQRNGEISWQEIRGQD